MAVETVGDILLRKLTDDLSGIVNAVSKSDADASNIEVCKLVCSVPINKAALQLILAVVPNSNNVPVVINATNQGICGSRIFDIGEGAVAVKKRRCGRLAGGDAVIAYDLS